MNYYYTVTNPVTPEFFNKYLSVKEEGLAITGSIIDALDITIVTSRDLTETEQTDLHTYVTSYTDFDQELIDETTLEKCKTWGKQKILEMEIKNMNRKRTGIMARQELEDILMEIHNSFVFMMMLEGSLDTLHGKLFGYPEQTIDDVTWAARAATTFTSVWTEDVDWLKTELTTFLATL